MAIREIFTRFEFAWDRGALARIAQASERVEARIRGTGRAFDGAAQKAAQAAAPTAKLSAGLQRVGAAGAAAAAGVSGPLTGLPARLRAVGAAAVRASQSLGMAGARRGLAGLSKGVAAATSRLARARQAWRRAFAVAPIDQANDKLKMLLGTLGVFGGALGAVFAGRAVIGSVTDTLAFVDAQAKMATQLAVSTEALQALDTAANLSGFNVQELRIGVTTMTRNLGLFIATGKGRSVAILREMGIAAEDLEKQTPDELFWRMGKAFAAMEDPMLRSAFAQRVFGDSGAKMLALFKGTPEEIDGIRRQSEELGVLFSGQFAKDVEATRDQMYLAGLQFKRIQIQMVGHLAPSLIWISAKIISLAQAFHRLTERNHSLQAAFASAGWLAFRAILAKLASGTGGLRAAFARLWPVLLRIGRVLLPWVAWTLILDDVITFLRAGKSALGRFLNLLFGAGAAQATLEALRAGWDAVRDVLMRAGRAVRAWLADSDESTRKATAGVALFALIAASGLGKMLIKLGLLAAAWLLQVARIGAVAAAWTTAQAGAIALSGSLTAMAAAAGAAAAAIGAIWLAWQQGAKLLETTGGWEGLWEGVKSFASGEGAFAGVDAHLNKQARERAAKRAEAEGLPPPEAMLGTGTRVGSGAIRIGRTVPSGPSPVLRTPGLASARSVTLVDQRSTNIDVAGAQTPAATARAVGAAVAREQRTDIGALKGALLGAGRD